MMKQKIKDTFLDLKDVFGWTNVMESPKIEKIIVTSCLGKLRKEKDRRKVIIDRLTKITGQKPIMRKARKSIATFKLREGDLISYMVTLRNENMYEFLNKLINISLPRMRDFQGISRNSIDQSGNLTIGIKEHNIFPEIPDENLQDIFPLAITIVSSTPSKEIGFSFFEKIGIPFKAQG